MEKTALNEMQALRLMLAKESDFDVKKAKSVYDFIVDENTPVTNPIEQSKNPDGIYFILSSTHAIPAMYATAEDKKKAIAVGYKLGGRFANVTLHNAAEGKEIALCFKDKCPCGSKERFHNSFKEAIADWDGIGNTQNLKEALDSEIELKDNEYIPSIAELHFLSLFVNEVNAALIEAGGEPLVENWYWSSTEYNTNNAWYVNFCNGYTNYYFKYIDRVVRPAVAYKPL